MHDNPEPRTPNPEPLTTNVDISLITIGKACVFIERKLKNDRLTQKKLNNYRN
jgi:hypothetical protein